MPEALLTEWRAVHWVPRREGRVLRLAAERSYKPLSSQKG